METRKRRLVRQMVHSIAACVCGVAAVLLNPVISGQVTMSVAGPVVPAPASSEEEDAPQHRSSSEIAEPRREADYVSASHAAGQRQGPPVLFLSARVRISQIRSFLERADPASFAEASVASGLGTPLRC